MNHKTRGTSCKAPGLRTVNASREKYILPQIALLKNLVNLGGLLGSSLRNSSKETVMCGSPDIGIWLVF